jgi:hypothetical protein
MMIIPASAQAEVFRWDFENGAGPEWSNMSTSTTPTGRKFLGEFGNEDTVLSLQNLPEHSFVIITFDLFIIRSWDGNNKQHGTDKWYIRTNNGSVHFCTSFANTNILNPGQFFPNDCSGPVNPGRTGAVEIDSLGYGMDSVYHLEFIFSHTENSLQVEFWAEGLQIITDESWGLDNVKLEITSEPPAQEKPVYEEPNLPAEPNKLVLITHGYTGPLCVDKTQLWVLEMCWVIDDIFMGDPNWHVEPYYWLTKSNTKLWRVLLNAVNEGLKLGEDLFEQNYQHIHLIGHSAGSGLIQAAVTKMRALEIRNGRPFSTIHTTFLDPFEGLTTVEGCGYGLYSNWSDNYFSNDFTWYATNSLQHAHNANLDLVDPALLNSHSFCTDWYYATITGEYPDGRDLNDDNLANGIRYGFPRSLGSGDANWQESLNLPIPNETIRIGSSSDMDRINPILQGRSIINISTLSYINSTTGNVEINGTRITMDTNSPVWSIILLDVNEPVNFLTFDANFTSEPNAEGLLAVYWGEEHLGSIDERYVLDGVQKYSFELPQIYQSDTYLLKLRVDSFSETPTTVVIDNISTGVGTSGYDYKIDGKIDFLDFAKFSLHWCQTDCNDNNNWCDRVDLDESGSVEPNDLMIFTQHWLEGAMQ